MATRRQFRKSKTYSIRVKGEIRNLSSVMRESLSYAVDGGVYNFFFYDMEKAIAAERLLMQNEDITFLKGKNEYTVQQVREKQESNTDEK